MADPSDPRAVYETRLERFGGARDHHAQRSRLVAYARLAAVLPAGACLVAAITAQDAVAGPLLWAGGALLAVFAALVVYHGRVDERRAATQAL